MHQVQGQQRAGQRREGLAESASKTALKISTPIIEARAAKGSGRISTVSTISTQAQTVHRRSEVHQGLRASEDTGEASGEVCSDITLPYDKSM